jgi:hypothetical protein
LIRLVQEQASELELILRQVPDLVVVQLRVDAALDVEAVVGTLATMRQLSVRAQPIDPSTAKTLPMRLIVLIVLLVAKVVEVVAVVEEVVVVVPRGMIGTATEIIPIPPRPFLKAGVPPRATLNGPMRRLGNPLLKLRKRRVDGVLLMLLRTVPKALLPPLLNLLPKALLLLNLSQRRN